MQNEYIQGVVTGMLMLLLFVIHEFRGILVSRF